MASEKLQVILELLAGQYKREAREAATATGRIARSIEEAGGAASRLGPSMTTAGRAMTGFGVAAIGSLGLAAKAAIDWETAFAGVRKTVEATEPEFAALERGILDLSLVAPVAAEELAGIAEAAGQLGIKNEAILGFTETMAALGVTTNLTADEAATAFARIANVMQLPQDQFDEMGSAVVDLGNKLASTESEITEFATRIAGAGKIAGLSVADVLAIGGAFSSVGIEAEAGGTAIQKVLLNMTDSVATGAGNLETFARVSGLTAQEFVQTWQDDPAEAFALFVEGLGRAGDDAFTILEELGLTDQRLIRSFLSMAGAGDLLRSSLELGNEAYRENNALTAEAEERYKTVASELQMFVNSVKVLAIEIGNTLLPVIRAGADAAGSLAEWFAKIPEPLKIAVVSLTGLVGAMSLLGGAALIVIPRIAMTIKAVKDLRTAIVALRTANVAGALGGSGAAGGMVGLAGAMGLVAAAVLALELGIRALKDATDDWTGSTSETQRGFGGFIQGLSTLQVLTGNYTGAILAAAEATEDFPTALKEVGEKSEDAAKGVEHMADATKDDLVPAIGGALGSLDKLAERQKTAADRAKEHADRLVILSSRLAASISPALTAIQAVQDLKAAQEEAATALIESGEASDEYAEAQIRLALQTAITSGALAQFGLDADSSARAVAEALNIPYETALAFLETLELLDGKHINITARLDWEIEALGAGVIPEGLGIRNPPTVTSPIRTPTTVSGPYHSGGIVPGPIGSDQLIMAQGGEMVVPLSQTTSWGDMSSNVMAFSSHLSAPSRTVNQYFQSTGFIQPDVQYAAVAATVVNLVE